MPGDQGPGENAGPAAAPEPAKLPGNAPTALGNFVGCTIDSVDLDLADVGWLPKPEAAPDFLTPSASVEDGWTPQRATIRIGYGDFMSLSIPASIVDGRLSVDSSNLGFGIGDEVTRWVDAFNATLATHDKQLDRLDVRGDTLTLTKRPVVAASDHPAAAPAAAVTTGATTVPDAPSKAPADGRSKPPGGCLPWIAGALAAIAVAIGIGVVATSGGDSDEQGDPPGDTTVVTDVSPVTNPPTTGPPTTDPLATDPPPTDAPTSDPPANGQVGAAPTDPAPAFCADFDALADRFDGDLDGYMLIGGNCAPRDGAYLPRNCDPDVLPWCASGPDPAFGATGATPGWVHQPSQPDLFTGVEGPSYATIDFYMRSWNPADTGTAFFGSDCGGQQLSGAGVVAPDGSVTVEHPLLTFGPCQVIDLTVAVNIESENPGAIVIPPSSLAAGGFFEVGPGEPTAAPFDPGPYPQLVGPDAVPQGWSDSVQTIDLALGGGAPLGDGCSTMVEPQAIHGSTVIFRDDASGRCADRFWVFAAARQPGDLDPADAVVAHNAAFVNPLGEVRPAIADTIEFHTSDPLFDGITRDPIFPCGPGHLAFGICAPDAKPVDAGALVSVGIATGGSIPLEWDGTPRSYTVEFDQAAATALLEEAGWTLQTDEPRTRALLRDDSITFVFPQDAIDAGPEDPGSDGAAIDYVLRSMVDDVSVDQPSVPVVGLVTTPAVLPEQPDDAAVESPDSGDDDSDVNAGAPTESLDDFYTQLSTSLASGDLTFSLERLDPLVYEAYPTECPAALESFADPEFVVTLISDDGPSAWIWELPDGRTYDVPDAVAATVTVGGRGQSGSETQAHVQLHDGRYHWFTYCVP